MCTALGQYSCNHCSFSCCLEIYPSECLQTGYRTTPFTSHDTTPTDFCRTVPVTWAPLAEAEEYRTQSSVSPIVAKKWLHFAVVVNRGAPCSTADEPTSTGCSQIQALALGHADSSTSVSRIKMQIYTGLTGAQHRISIGSPLLVMVLDFNPLFHVEHCLCQEVIFGR